MREEKLLREYYQRHFMKSCRDLAVFHDSYMKLERFDKIDEMVPEMEKQKEFRRDIEFIKISEELVAVANRHWGMREAIELVEEKLNSIGFFTNKFGALGLEEDFEEPTSPGLKGVNRRQASTRKSQMKLGSTSPPPQVFKGFPLQTREDMQALLDQGKAGFLDPPVATAHSGKPLTAQEYKSKVA